MIVNDLPALRPLLHDQGEGSASSDLPPALKHETCSDQRESGAQGTDLNGFEPQAVPASVRGEPVTVVLPNEVDSVPGPSAIDERSRTFGGIVGEKSIQVPPVPVRRRPVQLRHNGFAQRLPVNLADGSSGGAATGPASRKLEGQKQCQRAHGYR